MNAKSIIERKRDGHELGADEIRLLVRGGVAGDVPDYQLTAWMMAVFFRGMSFEETAALTKAMIETGDTIDFEEAGALPVDKHSTGGVGDKLSFLVAPITAAAGARVPMISGRSLGHTGGTLDKLESIPGYRTALGPETFRRQVETIGLSIAGQSERIVPADRILYSLRDAASIVESVPLITASILSKKSAEGSRALVLDVKVGGGAFMSDPERGRELARSLVQTARRLGLRVVARLTRMDHVLGRTAGNALEIRESIEFLRGESNAPDLAELTRVLGADMLRTSGVESEPSAAEAKVGDALSSGAGYEKFLEMVRAQDGDVGVVEDPDRLPRSHRVLQIEAPRSGVWVGLYARGVGEWITRAGGGRTRAGQSIDPVVGTRALVDRGETVQRGRPILELHLGDPARSRGVPSSERDLSELAQSWMDIRDPGWEAPSMILETMDPEGGASG